MRELRQRIKKLYKNIDGLYTESTSEGYWSNLNEKEQEDLLSVLEDKNCRDAVKEKFPHLEDIIFEPGRAAGLKLLDIKTDEIGVDYGCMWGNLLIYSAKNCKAMVGVDQTRGSLKFLQYRLKEENLDNCFLINCNLRKRLELDNTFDFAIVNGVLEWIPEDKKIQLKKFFKKGCFQFRKPKSAPRVVQLEFLKMIFKNLKRKGRLYLAIENRYDYQYFLWKKDQHSNLMYTAFLPREISNIISNIWYGRPYVNYLYSQNELEKLLKEAGFENIKKYAAFPDYRFPQKIIPLRKNITPDYRPGYRLKKTKNLLKIFIKKSRTVLDLIVYKKLGLFNLSPSFIIIAGK